MADDEYDDYESMHKLGQTNNEINANKKNVPVKTHIRKIEENLAELKKDLNENRKNAQTLRTDINSLEHRTKERLDDITKLITDDLTNLDKDMRRVQQSDKTETDFFRQQINSLVTDKTKLQQNVISLSTRMDQCETDVGISYK